MLAMLTIVIGAAWAARFVAFGTNLNSPSSSAWISSAAQPQSLSKAVKSLSSSGELREYLADSDATLQPRDGRYVVPVLLQNKHRAGVEVGVAAATYTTYVWTYEWAATADARRAQPSARHQRGVSLDDVISPLTDPLVE